MNLNIRISEIHPLLRDIVARRTKMGLTQAMLAEKAGISRRTLSNIETGRYGPRRKNFDALTAALKYSQADRARLQKHFYGSL